MLALLLLPGPAPSGAPAMAEYAVRWDPARGGLASIEDVLGFFGAPETKGETYEVRYFDLPRPAGAPTDATVILRRRRKAGGASEIRLKYRTAKPLARGWSCPAGGGFRPSEEVDVTVVGSGPPGRFYAYSCTLSAEEPPAFLAAAPKRCASRMSRYVFRGFKIEEWILPGGAAELEVSRRAPNDDGELARFERLVSRLRERGVRPSDRSKTELGSDCPDEK